MIAALIVLGVVFVFTEILHFKREGELIRRLASKNEDEYVKNYEKQEENRPLPVSPAKEAMKRWKSGAKG